MATQRISFDIDADEHKYLKMCCAKLGVKLKDFATKAIIEAVEAHEDHWLSEISKNKPEEEGANFVLIDHDGVHYDLPR
ncbi:MAG: hypothetical protein PHS86_02005 [Syntrophaceae bacterium]|nr:hypothetical protein [Syntrophaceae bacterium]